MGYTYDVTPSPNGWYVVSNQSSEHKHPYAHMYLQGDGTWNWHSPHYFSAMDDAADAAKLAKPIPKYVCNHPACSK